MLPRFFESIFCALFIMAPLLYGQVISVPVSIQYPLLVKTLSYDRNYKQRAVANGNALVVGILFQEGFSRSRQTKDDFESAYRESHLTTVGGISVKIVPIAWSATDKLKESVKARQVSVLYVTPMRSAEIGEIAILMNQLRVITFSAVPEYVEEGMGIGFDSENNRPIIMINLESVRESGADFSAQLLKVSRIVK